MILRVLDAFRPRGATWSGQVISSPPGPSGGPVMTHLLPGGGVPRVHRARSPVPPRLPHFATPRSVPYLAAVAAGAYPLRRPPDVWSPGAPAPPGPCYWLVASGTPVGWRGGCLALGLVRGAVRHYCLGGCSALVVCARRSRGSGGLVMCRVLCLPRFPLPALRVPRCVWRAVPSGFPLSSLAGTPFHAVCVFRGLGPVALLVFPACPLCVCVRPPPLPPRVGVARAPRTVPVPGAGRAVQRGPCPSACPASVPCSVWLAVGGGGTRSRFPLPGLGLRAPRGVGAGVGTRHPRHSARSCELASRAVGAARGRPGAAPLAWVWGVRGRALSHPRPLVLSGVRPGPTTHWLWVWGLRAWGPVTNPTARALVSWLCALWGRHRGARGGGPLAWASGIGRSPTPDSPSFGACGRGPLPTSHGCGGCGHGDPSPTLQRALLRAGFAHCGGGMRVPGGGASCLGVGRPGSGALPPPTTGPFRRAAGAHYPLAVGAGGAGVGTRHQPHSARSCELALRAVGAA